MKFFRFLILISVVNFFSCGTPIDSAPDFKLPFLSDSSASMTLFQEIQEHPVLLVFWATWCPICVSEIPALNQFQKDTASRGLKIYGINIQEPRKKVEEFALTHPVEYPILLDESGEVSEKYKVSSLPTMILLAKGGKILYYGFHLPENYLGQLGKL